MPLESPLGTAPELAGPTPSLAAAAPHTVNAIAIVGLVALGIWFFRSTLKNRMKSVLS